MKNIVKVGLGAGLMYLLDPERGARRRARIREQAIHSTRKTSSLFYKASRDVSNRTHGMVAILRSFFSGDQMVDDSIIIARIRSKLGRYVSHPHAIEVTSSNGIVTLSGLVLEHEVGKLLLNIRRISGIKELKNSLKIHKQNDNIPSLQGGTPRLGEKLDIFQTNWAPATRVIAGCAGLGLFYFGTKKESRPSLLLRIFGVSIFLRSLTNLEFKKLFGLSRTRNAIGVQKILHIDAPVEKVYEFWSNFENFPSFMTDVREVRVHSNLQSHWTVAGPAGIPLHWEAAVTKAIPNQILAWKTLKGAGIPHSGMIAFDRAQAGGTRITLHLFYNPPGGALGHFAAHMLGADPKSKLDEALAQMKTLIEQGPSERQLRHFAVAG
jgi:uncharacterized membrane protein